MKRIVQAVTMGSLLFLASLAAAQYEAEPYIEGFIGGNFTLPFGYIASDLEPTKLQATNGFGLELGGGYYFKPQIIAGAYFSTRNMGTDDAGLNHRIFEVGLYGKYLISDLTAKSFSPYVRASAGVAFNKLATEVSDNNQPVLRELSYKPALGTEIGLGIHYRTNSYGAVYGEVAYHLDLMNGVKGTFQSVDYPWGDNNGFLELKAGVSFNIGPKE
jgi:hypothetical protein